MLVDGSAWIVKKSKLSYMCLCSVSIGDSTLYSSVVAIAEECCNGCMISSVTRSQAQAFCYIIYNIELTLGARQESRMVKSCG